MVAKIMALRHNFVGHKLFVISFKKFLQDDCFNLSLSVSFVFLLSIIPFATLSILIVDFLQKLFFAQANWTGQVTEMLADEMNQVIPFVSREWMKSHVINSDSHGSFRVINFLMLPIISGLIFKTLRDILPQNFPTAGPPPAVRTGRLRHHEHLCRVAVLHIQFYLDYHVHFGHPIFKHDQ